MVFEVIVILPVIVESEQGEDAKHKKLDSTKPAEPSTPDYAAGLPAVAQPNKVILSLSIYLTFFVNMTHHAGLKKLREYFVFSFMWLMANKKKIFISAALHCKFN